MAKEQFASDLNLDVVISGIGGRRRRNGRALSDALNTPLSEPGVIGFRQDIFRDLEDPGILEIVEAFSAEMEDVYRHLRVSSGLTFPFGRKGWFIAAASVYCDAVTSMEASLRDVSPGSEGLTSFVDWLGEYARSPGFEGFSRAIGDVRSSLSAIEYRMDIRGREVHISKPGDEADHGDEIRSAFAPLRGGALRSYFAPRSSDSGLSYLEQWMISRLGRLYPEEFRAMDEFCDIHDPFVDPSIERFFEEIQFYLAYLEYIADVRRRGLPFCLPRMDGATRGVGVRDIYDLALAKKLAASGETVITNDFDLSSDERIIVITGANQGGKTTFARAFGQAHFLASLGCPIPGSFARLSTFDTILTHFEREERMRDLRGKMEDDLIRMKEVLDRASSDSLLIMNEMFNSATVFDESTLSRLVMEDVIRIGCLGVCVTFVEELADIDDGIVSLVAQVCPDDPSIRTYRLTRQPPDGLAYAVSIAEKYGLTRQRLEERIE